MRAPKLLYIDGPSKAGKSMLLLKVKELYEAEEGPAEIRRPTSLTVDDRGYAEPLLIDLAESNEERLIAWDQGWAAEHVNAGLLGLSDHRLTDDPWLGEWLYGRAFQTQGLRVMLLPESVEQSELYKEEYDREIAPAIELSRFQSYGRLFGYTLLINEYTEESLLSNAIIILDLLRRHKDAPAPPPVYCGPPDAKIVLIGQDRDFKSPFPGSFLPFTNQAAVDLGRSLGRDGLRCGWTNSAEFPPQELGRFETVIAFGERAAQWAKFHANHANVVELHAMRWLFSHNENALKARDDSLVRIKNIIGESR